MTLPSERINAIRIARQFLYDLLDPKKTPRIPTTVRRRARSVLRHYPGDIYLSENTLSDIHCREAEWETRELIEKLKNK